MLCSVKIKVVDATMGTKAALDLLASFSYVLKNIPSNLQSEVMAVVVHYVSFYPFFKMTSYKSNTVLESQACDCSELHTICKEP